MNGDEVTSFKKNIKIGFVPFTKKEVGILIAGAIVSAVIKAGSNLNANPDVEIEEASKESNEQIFFSIDEITASAREAHEHEQLREHDKLKETNSYSRHAKKNETELNRDKFLLFTEGAIAAKAGFLAGSVLGGPIGGAIGVGVAVFVNTILIGVGKRVTIDENKKRLSEYITDFFDPSKRPLTHVMGGVLAGAAYGSLLLPGVGTAIGAGIGLFVSGFNVFRKSNLGNRIGNIFVKWGEKIGIHEKQRESLKEMSKDLGTIGAGAFIGLMAGPPGVILGASIAVGKVLFKRAWNYFNAGHKIGETISEKHKQIEAPLEDLLSKTVLRGDTLAQFHFKPQEELPRIKLEHDAKEGEGETKSSQLKPKEELPRIKLDDEFRKEEEDDAKEGEGETKSPHP